MTFRPFMRASLLIAGGTLIVALLAVLYLSVKDYRTYFDARHGTLVRSGLEAAEGDSLNDKFWLTLENDNGLGVECGLLVPHGTGRKFPAIILLGGKVTGRHAVDYALDVGDAIIIAPDYPFEARESYTIAQFLADVPGMRRGLIDMIPSVMLVTDYLFRRDDVDTTKIVLLGYSFGAPFVPCLAANDHRFAVAAMVYGGGDLYSLIRHNVRRYRGALVAECAGLLGGTLLRPLEPLRYADKIAPTPLVMINGAEDEQIPPENVRLLFAAAREPKKQIWLESRHVNPANVELTRRIINALRSELVRLKVLASVGAKWGGAP